MAAVKIYGMDGIMNETYWRLPEDEQPQDENKTICVLYISDAQAVVTTWADEKAEKRIEMRREEQER